MDKHIDALLELRFGCRFDAEWSQEAAEQVAAIDAAIALMRDDCARRAAMDKHASAQEELAIARATIESLRMRLSGCESALAERDAAIALMRGQSEAVDAEPVEFCEPRFEKRFTCGGRSLVAELTEFRGHTFVERIYQVVRRPRAYGEVKRRIWPASKPNAIANIALQHLRSDQKGKITEQTK